MKKIHSFKLLFAILLVVFALGLSACGNDAAKNSSKTDSTLEQEKKTEIEEENVENTDDDEKKETDSPYIYESVSIDGVYKDDYGNQWDYSYHLPQLDIDSADARSINREIETILSEDIKLQVTFMNDKTVPEFFKVFWTVYENEGLLSLVIKADALWGNYTTLIYNYDLEKNVRLTTYDLLERLGYDKDSFDMNVKKSAVRAFDDINKDYMDSYYDPYLIERRAFTACNAMIDENLFYYDGNTLRGALCLGSLAGETSFLSDVKIVDEPPVIEGAPDQCSYSFVWAMRKENNEIYISFEETDEAKEYLGGSFASFGNHMVEGCYSDYKAIHLGSLGYSFNPYLFLLTEDGHVEFVDVFNGYMSSGSLCSSGPMCMIKDVVKFEDSSSTVYAVTKYGEKIDLSMYVNEYQITMPPMYSGTSFAKSGEIGYNLEISEKTGEMKLGLQHGSGPIDTWYKGSIRMVGMTEEGVVYSYCLTEEGSEKLYLGCFTILSYSNYMDSYMDVQWASGDNPFGTVMVLSFERSYG